MGETAVVRRRQRKADAVQLDRIRDLPPCRLCAVLGHPQAAARGAQLRPAGGKLSVLRLVELETAPATAVHHAGQLRHRHRPHPGCTVAKEVAAGRQHHRQHRRTRRIQVLQLLRREPRRGIHLPGRAPGAQDPGAHPACGHQLPYVPVHGIHDRRLPWKARAQPRPGRVYHLRRVLSAARRRPHRASAQSAGSVLAAKGLRLQPGGRRPAADALGIVQEGGDRRFLRATSPVTPIWRSALPGCLAST
jgi:hypothetical protein